MLRHKNHADDRKRFKHTEYLAAVTSCNVLWDEYPTPPAARRVLLQPVAGLPMRPLPRCPECGWIAESVYLHISSHKSPTVSANQVEQCYAQRYNSSWEYFAVLPSADRLVKVDKTTVQRLAREAKELLQPDDSMAQITGDARGVSAWIQTMRWAEALKEKDMVGLFNLTKGGGE